MSVTTAMIKELRDKTGAGMMDAKKALVENNGDMDAAIDWLRTKGLSKAEKKSGRTAAEGLVAIATKGNMGAVVEVNSETDFVARNEGFQNFVKKIADIALTVDTLEELAAKDFGNGKPVSEALTDLIAKIGENMGLRRMEKLSVSNGVVASYVHGELAPNLGKIGVLVGMQSNADAASLQSIGKQVAMHVAAANPQFLDKNNVDADALERERSVLKEQAVASGKPPEIAEKMVEGRIRKYYEEVCLTEQVFVIDGESKVCDILKKADAELTGFVRMQLGEGIEKEEEDFAAEVSKVAAG